MARIYENRIQDTNCFKISIHGADQFAEKNESNNNLGKK